MDASGPLSLGESIRHWREAAGLSREQLATELTRSAESIARWERDLNRPPRNVCIRVADILGVPFEEFDRVAG